MPVSLSVYFEVAGNSLVGVCMMYAEGGATFVSVFVCVYVKGWCLCVYDGCLGWCECACSCPYMLRLMRVCLSLFVCFILRLLRLCVCVRVEVG